ncbi:hypothetical protein SAMN05444920_111245 [Nonomuraea solani]|uniref:Uncharacterized protein n=1 Tax=Nonomuraea solani TaxID=1144553 RepID=A0A1H6EK48_9ACTN|nr:hypothetical protein [Nonomuraea solani]SEG98227.1 hypothetical protein SAMN05444920_111245 [Nonomuraea solani]
MMQLLGPWPNMNEDDVRAEGNASRVSQAGTAPAAAGADTAVRTTQQVYHGQSATSMETHWEKTGAQNGHVAQANSAMRMTPVALEGTASVVAAVKVAAGTQAVFTSVAVAKALMFGGAAGATLATARVLASRQAVRRVLREGSEGTGKVIGPIVRRRITDPMRRILDDLRRPGGPGPRLAVAGPRGGVPLRTSGLRNPTGPRSVQDGIARMGRNNRRDNNRGNGRGDSSRRGGGGFFSRNSNNGSRHDGRIHGDPPSSAKGMTEKQAKEARAALEKSIKARKREEDQKGWEAGHAERIRREERALKDLNDSIRRKQYDADVDSTPSSSGGNYSGGSQAQADRYPTDAEWAEQQRKRKW